MGGARTDQSSGERTWPVHGLDLEGLKRTGWQPLAFNQFIVKIHSRCNLACDYCYIYEMADQSWRDQPKVMRGPTFAEACRRIGDHVRRFSIPAVSLVFHGGEPLLVGHEAMELFARSAAEDLGGVTRVDLGVQTNGLLLDAAFLEIFDRWNVRVGVSLDGARDDHDRHRRFRGGAGSYDQVAEKLSLLARDEYRHLFSGLLCAIDVDNDPVDTYETLVGFGPPGIDFLLPHGNWMTPPPRRTPDAAATPYGDWLIAVFDRWYNAPRLETRVRIFEEIIDLVLGGDSRSESVGLSPIRVAVIETDGSLEQVDALKSAFPGAAKIHGLAVGNPLDLALWNPPIVARQIGAEALSQTCRECPIHRVCGGGNYTHRYRADNGFLNPSVYCPDLTTLITHIQHRIETDIGRLISREQ
jgi:uncharacterized protein